MEEYNIKSTGYQPQNGVRKAYKTEEVVQLIVFVLGNEEFGANIEQVREIIKAKTITPIPNSPEYIDGLANVRGEIALIIDLKERLFLQTKTEIEEKHIVMVEQEKNLFGLKVDEVVEVIRIPETEIKTAPELVSKVDTNYILGVITLNNRLILLLDLKKILSEEELNKLSEIRLKYNESMEYDKEKEEVDKEVEKSTETLNVNGQL